jgi:hypothetical protein
MNWWLTSFAMFWQAQAPETILFNQIQAKVAENLSHLPDYTCSQTIERFKRSKPGAKVEPVDTIRLEVAYVGGRELFGWPGSHKIDEPDINKFIGRGTAGNGDFAIFPRNLFLRLGAKFYYGGRTELDGKPAFRFNYRIPQSVENYQLRTSWGQAFVGYEGSFWVDAVTLDLMRLTSAVNDIPAKLRLKSTITVLDYGRVGVGGSTFLLPKGSELTMVESDGVEYRNRNSFSACHQFTGESVIKFDEPTPEPAANAPVIEAPLPDEFTVEIELDSPIDSASAVVGDPIHATIKQNVKSNREIVIPKGAKLAGNLVLLEKRGNSYFVVLRFTSVELDSRSVDLSGRDNRVDSVRLSNGRTLPMFAGPMFYRTDHLKLARGTVFQFRSRMQRHTKPDC